MNSEVQDPHIKNTPPPYDNSSESLLKHGVYEVKMMQDDGTENWNAYGEDQDEDVDFNPILKENLSSSLSSEVEDLDIDGDDTAGDSSLAFSKNLKETHLNVEKDRCTTKDVEGGGNILNQTNVSSRECGRISEINCAPFSERGLVSESQDGLLQDKENQFTGLTDVRDAIGSREAIVNMDTEGAIGMRTRARCSLTSFTLDELETFLQESDDDDLQNVDEQEEYKKFLSAVLQVDDSLNLQRNADGDDEEDDADFELELQQTLERDHDEIEERHMSSRKKCQKASSVPNRKKSCQSTRPLPPILPFSQMGSFSTFDKNQTTASTISSSNPPPYNACATGFSPDQIGQLHCLIHEHVQLLIQVFSVCVSDLAKTDITAQIKNLILELLKKRDESLGWRTHPFPSFCFFPPYIHPSVADEPHPYIISSSDGIENHQSDEDLGCFRTHGCAAWVPYICGTVLSITDVAPLRLVQSFIDDVSSAVMAHRRNQIELGLDFETGFGKGPLFSFHKSSVSVERDSQGESITWPHNSVEVLSPSSRDQISTKTMAADLIKKSKKQPVALVPKEIAIMAQRFCQMFNPALYPRNPPPASVANRVLFTEAEDKLLALGIMEYNTDWKAIQQRFLPCKSSHQIFVRHKNRTTSKAPENPIKDVRRLKNSPLTPEEMAHIEVGLKSYNLDWISIWRLYVPHRDPSLLPRQWRIACGTQRSYKADENKKAIRRLYDFRKRKPTQSPSSDKEGYSIDNAVDDPNIGDILMDGVDKTYVHEAFLADWNPDTNASLKSPTLSSQKHPQASIRKDNSRFKNFQPQMWVSGPTSAKLPNSLIVRGPYPTCNHRNKHVNLVKLAPDLPPINLPPSVRVMPQSGFVKSGESTTDDQRKMDCEVDRVNTNFQMHPLLFEAPQIGTMPYYPPLNSSTNTLTFFPAKQPRINLNLLQNSRQIGDAVNILSKSLDIHFRPLLHDGLDTSSIHSAAKFLSDAEELRKRDPPDPQDSNFNMTSGTEISNNVTNSSKNKGSASNGTGNDLNSCELPPVTSRNIGCKEVADNTQAGSLPGIIMEYEELSESGDEEFENGVEFEHEEMADSVVVFEHEEMTDSVMEFEHEEMTDSDVEFEHEEMADSEDEEMQSDKMRANCVMNMKNNCEGRNSSRYNFRSKPQKRICGQGLISFESLDVDVS